MKVHELIARLQAFPFEARVVVPGYEYGYDDLEHVSEIALSPEQNEEDAYWAGRYNRVERSWSGEYKEPVAETAVMLVGRHDEN